jgi:hypothetical protein
LFLALANLELIGEKFGMIYKICNDFENIISVYDKEIIFNKKYNICCGNGNDTKHLNKKYVGNKEFINIKFEFIMKNIISNFYVIYYK